MSYLLPPGAGKVLAIGAHPDDIEIGAGGLVARLAHEGAQVTMVVASIPDEYDRRCKEAHKAAEVLGAQLIICGEKDRRLEDISNSRRVECFGRIIDYIKPDLVITHSREDLHDDHKIVNNTTLQALRKTKCDLLTYISSPDMIARSGSIGNYFVDITPYFSVKREALKCHRSQQKRFDINALKRHAETMGDISDFKLAEVYTPLQLRVATVPILFRERGHHARETSVPYQGNGNGNGHHRNGNGHAQLNGNGHHSRNGNGKYAENGSSNGHSPAFYFLK